MAAVKAELKARNVMTPDPVCVEASTTVSELARVFEEHEISGAPVVDGEGKVVGIVSKTDLIRRCAEGVRDVSPTDLFEYFYREGEDSGAGSELLPESRVSVEDFMTEDPLTVSPEDSAAGVARLMCERRVHRVIVVDDEKFPIGIVTSMDLLGVFPR